MSDTGTKTELKVAEAKARDAGRGIARIDPEIANKLGLVSGDVVQIKGEKRTVALLWPGYPEDAKSGIIRMDGALRRNANVSVDEKVSIKKIGTKPAKKLVFAPT